MERRLWPRTVALAALTVATATLIVMGALIDSTARFGRFGEPLDVDPHSVAAVQMARSTSADHALLDRIARRPVASWVAGSALSARQKVADAVAGAHARGTVATLVAYNIPGRDCGSYSASAVRVDAAEYRAWLAAFVAGLGSQRAIVIVEPDALAQLDCLDAAARDDRVALLRDAVTAIARQGSWAYIDAGHSGWVAPAEMAKRLESVGVGKAAGFALNVANFRPTLDEERYGQQVSDELASPAHFVIDTSRNGVAANDREWCNPAGRGLGHSPSTDTGHPLVDAFLWVKTPGASDGECNGGPPAGQWWGEYALELARNASGT